VGGGKKGRISQKGIMEVCKSRGGGKTPTTYTPHIKGGESLALQRKPSEEKRRTQ